VLTGLLCLTGTCLRDSVAGISTVAVDWNAFVSALIAGELV
jgi:hypothetical protein